ncbi:DUF1501 domain-containing protein [Aeromicrobium tamlense]|uniref:DUF1501 domain-containing protein n=1 Tax=Aeromicrobium tamlense TaxID=375541 RepID=A0A8I0FXZ7_9ACTN|nr:DUF1501 domain-containing protein [Aeromicrobium tamlense]MBD1269434.1 DUF1501 domain-containing protein [Aeromicrobium tamlense]NYI36658.1 uncharacterized protein (DUF1501 family) [Aeromicrobium tamlense]
MTDGHDASCADYGVTRRNLLRSAGLIGMAGVSTKMFGDVLTSTAYGATNGNILVVLSLRGGADGMSMMVPHAESAYYAARPNIAVKKGDLLRPDHTFGLHPSFKPLESLWDSGRMAAIHAVGLPTPNRSHFEAMELVEDADPGSSERIGWLNRVIGCFTSNDVFDGIQVGSTVMPTSLIGPEPSFATSDFTSLSAPWADHASLGPRVRSVLSTMYRDAGTVIGKAGQEALALDRRTGTIAAEEKKGPQHGAVYPEHHELGRALASSAALIRAGVGVRAIAVDFGGWDHHVDISWRISRQVEQMSKSIAAFLTDLGPDASRVTIVTLSEFGRRLGQNGAAGLDHGYGNAVFAFGAGVRGGYYANWPTLATDRRVDGDLAVTTDYRSVLAEILAARFPEVGVGTVFPGLTRTTLGFMSPY